MGDLGLGEVRQIGRPHLAQGMGGKVVEGFERQCPGCPENGSNDVERWKIEDICSKIHVSVQGIICEGSTNIPPSRASSRCSKSVTETPGTSKTGVCSIYILFLITSSSSPSPSL